MAIALALAAGIPGVAGGQDASANWMDLRLQTQLRLDAIVVPGPLQAGEDRALTRSKPAAKSAAGTTATARSAPVLKQIDYRAVALDAAKRAGIKRPLLFVRQIAAESGMQPCVVSGAGAIGIAQIMPATAASWGVDPWMPHDALRVAAQNMARYERQLGSYKLALAAYNAGPGAVSQYGGVPPYAETRGYISKISNLDHELPGMRQVFTIPQRYSASFRTSLGALMRDVERRGGSIKVEEGWRSYEESTRIWKLAKRQHGGWQRAIKWAAPPGCSNHVRGVAADLLGSKRSIALAHRLAGKHGLVFPMKHEPWHVERAGLKTQSS